MLLMLLFVDTHAFAPSSLYARQNHQATTLFMSPALSADRKRELLSRTGPYFHIDRAKGSIEFGATAQLTTPLPTTDSDAVQDWLWDSQSLSQSIWDPERTTALSQKNVYRLETMDLQFVTLKLSPWVDMEMKTIAQSATGAPVFVLQSVNFEPNIQVLPGMRINAADLGIVIETVGYLKMDTNNNDCLLYTSPSPRDRTRSRMPSSA